MLLFQLALIHEPILRVRFCQILHRHNEVNKKCPAPKIKII